MNEFYGSTHNHTDRSNYRLRDSTNSLSELCWYAAELGHNFIAITDHETVSTAIDCQDVEKSIREKYPNFKVIRGNEIYLCRNGLNKDNFVKGEDRFYHWILLAKDEIGHQQIREISTRAWLRSFKMGRQIRVPTYYSDLMDIIGNNPGHVIMQQSCLGGKLSQLEVSYIKEPTEEKWEYIKQWVFHIQQICGKENFFLEVQPARSRDQLAVYQATLKLQEETKIPVVISLDAHYLKKEDKEIHHAFLTAQDGDRETEEFYATTYMMSREEIHSIMDKAVGEEKVSEWMNNTKKIYDMCEDYDLTKPTRIVYLPKTVDTITDLQFLEYKDKIKELEYFYKSPHKENVDLAAAIVTKILSDKEQYDNKPTYAAIDDNLKAVRLASEKMNTQWSAYLLNMRDYIKIIWEKGNSLVGCSRGSGLGFILLNILDITQINPLREKTKTYSFRFLNPERVSPLDIDCDIEGGKRPQVYRALQEAYGEDRVSKVLTIRTEKPKSAILTACFLPDTLIQTDKGLVKIQDVNSSNKVLTINGYENVVVPTHRQYNDTIYSFHLSGIGLPLRVTGNHQFLICPHNRKKTIHGQTRNYKKCNLYDPNGNLIKECLSIEDASRYYANHYNGSYSSMNRYKKHNGYYILTSKNKEIKDGEIQWLSAEQICESDFFLSPIFENKEALKIEKIYFPKTEQNPHKKSCVYISEEIKIDKDLGELLGFYLAEGNINHNMHGITFTINKQEKFFKEKICFLLQKVFNISEKNISIFDKGKTEGLSIQVNSTPLGRWFNKYCSGLAYNKRIPDFILNSSKDVQLALLKGCFIGDGHGRKRTNGSFEGKITSISYSLIEGLWQIAARNGYNCSCLTEQNSRINLTYNLMFYGKNAEQLFNYKYNNIDFSAFKEIEKPIEYNGKNFYPIRINDIEVEKYNGLVYCLETPSHNYLINNIVSHNCRGLKIDPDEANYLASFIKSERGIDFTLEQTYYGDEENGLKPDMKFKELMDGKYNNVWKVAQKISGLCCGCGSHAGGVIFYDSPITETTALMKTANGDVITQYDLHKLESVSLLKIDLLSIEALDRMRACIDLLTDYNYLDKNLSLRERYESAVGVYNIDRTSPEMWKMVHEHKIQNLFQMEQDSGIKGIEAVKPETVDELAALNAVIRLMPPEGSKEIPVEKFSRFKNNIEEWYNELREWKVDKKYWPVLEKIVGITYGMCVQQEQFMMLVQQPELGGFSLLWSDKLRKSVAKKNPKAFDALEKEFFEVTKEKQCDFNLCNYVWKVLIAANKGYGFNAAHTLGYSIVGLQEMNLAYKYPIIFWNTANLIVDSGSMNLEDEIDLDNIDNSDEENDDTIKNSSCDYGRIATAIGKMKKAGISFTLPDINTSGITYTPDVENNVIISGLRGISRIGNQLIKDICLNRSYSSIEDFLSKVKVNKVQMINLIKAGCFDNLYKESSREEIMEKYIDSIADKKKRITLQNMQMLISKNMIPDYLNKQVKVFNFNKYLKKNKQDGYYILDNISFGFYNDNYDSDNLIDIVIDEENKSAKIEQKVWDNIYKKEMDSVRSWMKENQQEILNSLNKELWNETAEKYTEGNISKWEMDSLSFYYHNHELSNLKTSVYEISDYFKLDKEPKVEREYYTKNKDKIQLYKIYRIAGTVIDKDKKKNSVTLLTTSGVVTVKVWKNQFSDWDKQLSQLGADGKKHVLEKSWFTRGTKLIITGIRRGDSFIPKKYKNTEWPLFEKINKLSENGFILDSSTERIEIEED